MPKQRNELEAVIRQNPYAYAASFTASNQVEYEAWAEVGALFTDAKWIICKHTYDASGNLTRTTWGKPNSGGLTGDFNNVVGSDNTTFTPTSGITYV